MQVLRQKEKIMFFNDDKHNSEERSEKILPYQQLRRFVEKILRKRVNKPSDVEDISQDVFRRSWQWANNNDKSLSLNDWKKLIAKITFNEVNRFYAKKTDLLTDDFLPEDSQVELVEPTLSPQFILEIAEELRALPFRQRLSIVLHEAEILPYLKVVLPNQHIAELLEISEKTLLSLENEIPLSEPQIIELIESLTNKPCKSSIRDERCKGRKLLKRRLFGYE